MHGNLSIKIHLSESSTNNTEAFKNFPLKHKLNLDELSSSPDLAMLSPLYYRDIILGFFWFLADLLASKLSLMQELAL